MLAATRTKAGSEVEEEQLHGHTRTALCGVTPTMSCGVLGNRWARMKMVMFSTRQTVVISTVSPGLNNDLHALRGADLSNSLLDFVQRESAKSSFRSDNLYHTPREYHGLLLVFASYPEAVNDL